MGKKKKGGKKKGKKGKGKKSARVAPAPYYPVVLTANYKFGNVIAQQIQDNRKNNNEAAQRVREGGILILDERDGGESRLLSLSRLTLDELPTLSQLASHLTALDLSSNRLFDIAMIGQSLSTLKELREINLNSNNLTGALPDLNLPRLELFSASRNQITTLPDQFAQHSPNLITLNLSNNALISLSDLYGPHWKNIRVINVSSNKLTALPSNVGDFERLEVLKCSQNTIALIPTTIGECEHLHMLDVSANAILLLPQELEKNIHLKTINVSRNGLTRIDSELLKAFGTAGLRQLFCYKNKISSLPPSIGHIGTLEIFSISNNKVSKIFRESVRLFGLLICWFVRVVVEVVWGGNSCWSCLKTNPRLIISMHLFCTSFFFFPFPS